MFRYYRFAKTCYAYLSDIDHLFELERCRWFTRGWTLQELVAPKEVQFYSSSWNPLGRKLDLVDLLCCITRIPQQVLLTGDLDNVSVASKMSWAAHRQTTRTEDLAYCLMGIFGVHMPLLYGEGSNAFLRLQQEIMKISLDPSLFAWSLTRRHDSLSSMDFFLRSETRKLMRNYHGMFAATPAAFAFTDEIKVLQDLPHTANPTFTGSGISIALSCFKHDEFVFAGISCIPTDANQFYIAIPLFSWNTGSYSRYRELVLVHGSWFCAEAREMALFIKQPRSVVVEPPQAIKTFTIAQMLRCTTHFKLEEVFCLRHAKFSANTGQITLSRMQDGPHAALFFIESDPPFHGRRITKPAIRFAIIIGGDISRSNGAWVVCVPSILSDHYDDKNIQNMLDYNPDLEMSSFITKNYLKRYLKKADTLIAMPTGRQQKQRRLIKHSKDGYVRSQEEEDSDIVHDRTSFVYVDVELREDLCNFIERTMFVYIGISEEFEGETSTVSENLYPAWWEYKTWSKVLVTDS